MIDKDVLIYADGEDLVSAAAGRTDEDVAYWRGQLTGIPAMHALPLDRSRSDGGEAAGAVHVQQFGQEVVEKIAAFCQANDVTSYNLLQTAFAVLLARYSRESEVVIGAPLMVHGQDGFAVLRFSLGGGATFANCLAANRRTLQSAWEHGPVPFDLLGNEMPPDHSGDLILPFQFLFSSTAGDPGFAGDPPKVGAAFAGEFDLALNVEERGGCITVDWSYDAALLDDDSILRMAASYAVLLEGILADPHCPINALPLLSDADRNRLLVDWCATSDHDRQACIHELFEEQVRRSPQATALVFEGGHFSYDELNRRANRLAHNLVERGVRPDTLVGLCVERSPELVIGILAILKAGGAYLSLDPYYPKDRLDYMMSDSAVACVLTTKAWIGDRVPAPLAVQIDDAGLDADCSDADLGRVHGLNPSHLAYVIYTSGSTGAPKGVMVEHRNVQRLLTATEQLFGFSASDVWTLFHSYAFDFSVWEIWGALAYGGRLVVVPLWISRSPDAFYELLRDEAVTVLNQTPTAFMQLSEVDERERADLSLRFVIFGGEALKLGKLQPWIGRRGADRPVLVNMYGITETTVHVTYRRLLEDDIRNDEGSLIGNPIGDLAVYVLDELRQLAPIGALGEMYVGGAGVARGYLNRADLTSDRFIADPFGKDPGARLYRTGDLARWRSTGELEFLGRCDDQVKVRGFRIELGEIESVVSRSPLVQDAVATLHRDADRGDTIAVYLVPSKDAAPAAHAVASLLATGLADAERMVRLPNGMDVYGINPQETKFLYDEIFVNRVYDRGIIGLENGDCVFDVGANIGMFTAYLATKNADVRIYAFEPIRQIFEALEVNCRLYGGSSTRALCLGLSDAPGRDVFNYYPNNTVTSGISGSEDEVRKVVGLHVGVDMQSGADSLLDGFLDEHLASIPVDVEISTLSDQIRLLGVERIALLKIDVERSELNVLSGIADDDWQKIVRIVAEVHDIDGRLDEIVQLLAGRGYEVTHEADARYGSLHSVCAIRPAVGGAAVLSDRSESQWLGLAGIEETVRDACAETFPEYMIPASFTFLPAMPLTANGKIDKKALPSPTRSTQKAEYAGPTNRIEARICSIWQDVLKLNRISVHDNFFELGGHSLLAIRVTSLLRSTFDNEIEVRALFDHPTIAALAKAVENSRKGFVLPPIQPADRKQDLPLSYAQQRLWFADQYEGNLGQYNVTGRIHLDGLLDKTALERAIHALIERHEILRTLIVAKGGVGFQVVLDNFTSPLEERKLASLSPEGQTAEIARIMATDSRRPFDLSAELPIRFTLLILSAARSVLLYNMHHIVTDGWTLAIMQTELNRLYDAFSRSGENPLKPLRLHYVDYAVWQREWLEGDYLENELGYWREQLANLPVLHSLPLDKPRPKALTFDGDAHAQLFDPALTDRIRAFCKTRDVTLYMFLQSAFATLLARFSGETDIVMGMPVAGRIHKDLEPMLGFFVNNLVLRSRLHDNPRFSDFLAEQRRRILEAQDHQAVPFEVLVDRLQPPRALDHRPLFQIVLVLQNNEQGELGDYGLNFAGTLGSGDKAAQAAEIKYELELHVAEIDGALDFGWVYNRNLFEYQSIERMANSFALLVEAVLEDPDRPVQALPLLTDAEKQRLLSDWNATDVDYPAEPCIHELFEEQVRQRPDAPAIFFDGEQLTYGELNRRSNRLAHYLVAQGVKPDSLVGLCIERSLDMIVAILGILKASAAYVPLDPDYPEERVRLMLDDTAVTHVVTQQSVVGRFAFLNEASGVAATPIALDDPAFRSALKEFADDDIQPSSLGLTPANLAYVIYTSGSTGTPKGVCVEHRNTVALIFWARRAFAQGAWDRALASSSICFDASITEIFVPLTVGGTIRLVKDILDVGSEVLEDVTMVTAVPSAIETLLLANRITSVKAMNLGGEYLKQSLVDELYANGVDTVHDLYGPTEHTTYSTCCLRTRRGRTSIGRPIDNTRLYILDRAMQPVPVGVVGELYIGGRGLTRGYLNRPELTAERFVPNPFSEIDGSRLYRTGDLVRYLRDGNVEYIGRTDHQVKVRGFRIEAEEIESQLAAHSIVQECVVAIKNDHAHRRIVAYYVQSPSVSGNCATELRRYLTGVLPKYMIPDFFIAIDAIPLMSSGKKDRKALAEREIALEDLVLDPAARDGDENIEVKRGLPLPEQAPQTIEQGLSDLWHEVLEIEHVDPETGFFEAGGNSLLAMVIAHRISQKFNVEFKVPLLFKYPTINSMANYLAKVEESI